MAAKKNRQNSVVRLDFLAYLRVTGADAESFLQGQLSSDLRRLTPEQGQVSSYNSPKGRMLAVLHLFRRDDGIVLELHRSLLDSVLKRLRLFVLRSKVTITEAPELESFGLIGDLPAHLPCPHSPLACMTRDGIRVMRRLGDTPRYSVQGDAGLVATGAEEDWRLADIEAGVPTIFPATQDRFVPQWCNLDRLGGISFDKGCYTGQEIVARVHYLGEVKRRMTQAVLQGTAPAPGTTIEHGEVVDAVADDSGAVHALVVSKNR